MDYYPPIIPVTFLQGLLVETNGVNLENQKSFKSSAMFVKHGGFISNEAQEKNS